MSNGVHCAGVGEVLYQVVKFASAPLVRLLHRTDSTKGRRMHDPPRQYTPPGRDHMTVTTVFAGVANVLVTDGSSSVLVDGYFSRP